jgi:hypothetical protein
MLTVYCAGRIIHRIVRRMITRGTISEVYMDESAGMNTENQTGPDGGGEIVEVLLKKRAQLLTELRQYDASMSKLQKEYSARLNQIRETHRPVQDALDHVEALLQLEGWEKPRSLDAGGAAKRENSDAISCIDAAYKLLENVGQPLHYRTICGRLKEQGVYIPGKDAAATLLAKMSRDGRFKRIRKRGTYALSFWRISAAKSRSRASRRRTR